MPIQVSWENEEKTIVYTKFGESWSLEEFHACVDEMHNHVTSVTHEVHFIMDFSISRSSPAKLLSTGRHINNKTPSNSGITVIIGANGFVKAMLQVAEKLFLTDMNIYLAATLDEAHEMIAQQKTGTKG